jgi:excisionase family DNA binding protein
MDTNERFYTVAEIARMAKVSVRTVARWIKARKLMAYRNVEGGPWRVRESEWERFKKASREAIQVEQYKHVLEMYS